MNRIHKIIVPVFGGLGNQMFQVAHGCSIASKQRNPLTFVDLASDARGTQRKWELSCFKIERKPFTSMQRGVLISRISAARLTHRLGLTPRFGVYDEQWLEEQPKKLSVVSGYWQGEQFFENVRSEVRKLFTFPPLPTGKLEHKIQESTNSVAVHVRRGDYISNSRANKAHFVCDTRWYQNAIAKMREKLEAPTFFVFSDDYAWANSQWSSDGDVHVVESSSNQPAWVDMYKMTNCKHFIISNSSYSWWSSFLGKGTNSITVAPQNWFPQVATKTLPVLCSDWLLV